MQALSAPTAVSARSVLRLRSFVFHGRFFLHKEFLHMFSFLFCCVRRTGINLDTTDELSPPHGYQ